MGKTVVIGLIVGLVLGIIQSLIFATEEVTGNDVAYAEVALIMMPIRDALMCDIESTTATQWAELTAVLTANGIKTIQDLSGAPPDQVYSSEGIFDHLQGGEDFHPMMKYLVTVFFVCATPCLADVRLPKILGSNMVLQRNSDVLIWGWAVAGPTSARMGRESPGDRTTGRCAWPIWT